MRKVFVGLVLAALLMVTVVNIGLAAYPERTITIICPWSPGGGTDRTARFIANELQEKLGVPVVVANKTGGNGAVGHGAAAYAKADGYTIGNITMELSTISWLGLSNISYKNFEPIIQFNQDYAAVIVKADAPWDNIKDLIADIKENPEAFTFSGSGAGSIWDLARVGMLNAAGIDPKKAKWIPSKGAAPAITELLGGHVDVITCSYPEAAPQIEAGKLKALAIMAPERDPRFADVPNLIENGIDWSAGTWRGFAVPKGTPEDIVNKLYEAVNEITSSDKFKEFMAKNGFGIKVRGPEEFAKFLEEDYTRWERVLKVGGYIN